MMYQNHFGKEIKNFLNIYDFFFISYMTYFGTNAVPSVFILRKNKLLARLNSTNDIQILISLIESTLRM